MKASWLQELGRESGIYAPVSSRDGKNGRARSIVLAEHGEEASDADFVCLQGLWRVCCENANLGPVAG